MTAAVGGPNQRPRARRSTANREQDIMNTDLNRLSRSALGLLAGGTMLGSSCSSSDINAVIAGVNAVADVVSSPAVGNSVDLTRWLVEEFDD